MRINLSFAFKLLCSLVFITLVNFNLKGAHIVGGEMTYRCLDSNQYEITLTLFRDCNGNGFRNTSRIGYFNAGTGALITRRDVPRDTIQLVPLNAVSSCLIVPTGTCLEQATYIDTITLLPNANGYDISYSICCRSNGSNNINIPGGWWGGTGSTYHAKIPPNDTLCNSTPIFNSNPPVVLCINDPINIDYSATDIDGDSLVYDFITPYSGGARNNTNPNPAPPPYGTVNWAAGYNVNYQVPSSPALAIDSSTGLLTGTPNALGNYVTGVVVKEYRNGVLINTVIRDFLMIIVNCLPTSAAVTNPGVICNSYTVNFGNSSMGTSSTTYLWDFGDTTTTSDTSTAFSPQYTYPDTGVYTVTLISDPYSPACADTTTQQIHLYPIIGPYFVPPPDQCVIGNSFDFNAGGAYFPTTQIDWDFGPTATPRTDTTTNPTGITFSSPGLKVISLRYQEYGCDTTFYDTIEVYESPIADFSFSDKNCTNFSLSFFDSSLHAGSYYWDFGDASNTRDTSTLSNPTYTYPDTGVYTVMLVVDTTPNFCPDTIYKQVRINPLLNPSYTKPPNQCFSGNSFDFNAGGAFFSTTQIDWDFGPTATPDSSTAQNPTGIVYGSSGLKPISLTYRDFGCVATYYNSIEVYKSPVADFSFSDNNCVNHTINFYDSSLFVGNYFWDFGDTNSTRDTSTSVNPTFTFPDTGIYNVMLVVDSNNSICPDTLFKQVRIYPILNPFFVAPLDQCIGGNSFDFSAAGNFFNTTQIDWDFGPTATPDSSTLQNPTGIVYTGLGLKPISIRYRDFGCDTIFYDTVQVYESPIADFSFSDNNCVNHTINFYDSSLHAGSYFWDFGDTSSTRDTSTLANPMFTFPDTGVYTVMLVIDTAPSLCPDTIYKQVRINPILNPYFIKPLDQCILGNSFDFNAGGNFFNTTQIDWDFGPTATPDSSTLQNPTGIVYSSIGLKPISIRYRDFGCDTIFYDTIEVHQSPVADFSYTDEHCINRTIQFSDSSIHAGSYYWDFGVAGVTTDTSTAQNPTYTFPDSGTYTVMLVADSNNSICPDTIYKQVVILPILSPSFNAPTDQCLRGNSFDFNAGGDFYTGTQINWSFGSTATPDSSTLQNPTGIVYSTSGVKVITIRYREFGCDTSFTDSIEVFETPTSHFGYSENSCVDFTRNFYDSSLFVGDYYWDFGVTGITTDTSTLANPIYTFPDSGTYTVMLIIGSQNLACPDTSYQTIRIDPQLSPSFTPPANQCLTGNSFNFNAGGSFYSGTQIDWNFGNSALPATSTLQNSTGIVYGIGGKKGISLRYRDFGCDTTIVDSIHVYELPVADFEIDHEICIDLIVDFYDSSQFAGNYQWDFGVLGTNADTSTAQNPTYTYPDTGLYTVRLIVSSQYLLCAPDTLFKQVRIYPVLKPQFNIPANQCFVGNTFNVSGYGIYYPTTQIDWDFGNGAAPRVISDSLNPPSFVYNTSGKKAISLTFTDFACVITQTDTIEVYDNPVSDFGYTDNNCHDLIVQFHDSTQFTTRYHWDFGVQGINSDTSNLANPTFTYPDSGVYTIRLIADANTGLCPDTSYQQIHLDPILNPYYAKPANQCLTGNSFDFSAGGVFYAGTQIDWDFGSSAAPSTSSAQNPTGIVFNTSGKKAVTIRYREFGCDTTFTDTIEVYDNPLSNFGYTDNNCVDLTVQFHDSSQFATSYYWDFGVTTSTTDTSTSANPTFTYPDSGLYTVMLVVDGNTGLCPDTSYQQIRMYPILNPFFNVPVDQCLSRNSFDFNAGGTFFNTTLIDWDFGPGATPATSSNQNPTGIVYSTIGKKPITIRYRDFGCDTSFIDTVEVFSSPFSNFSYSDNNCVDFNIQFTDSSQFADFYYWDFGVAGSTTDTSTSANPSFTFPDSGTYNVMLVAGSFSSICPDTFYRNVVIHPLLNPFFAKPINQCLNGNLFDFNAGGNFYGSTMIDWDFGPTATPSSSTATNPTGITYSSIGLKPITIRYRAFGCDTSFTDTIEIYNSPFSDFSFSDNNCVDFNIQFYDSSQFADFLYWDFGVAGSTTDTSTQANPSFTFPDSGTYNVMLIAGTNSSICPDTSYQTVTMYPLLVPNFIPPPNQCIDGNSFDFNAGGNYYTTTNIDWDFGASATPSTFNGANPTGITFNTVGKKAVTIRYRANGCDTSYTDTIEVYQSPFSDFTFSPNNCWDFSIDFTELSRHAETYYWDFGDTNSLTDTSTLPNPTFVFPDSGVYTVMLVIDTFPYFCPDTFYRTVTMHPLLSPYFAAPGPQCLNENSFNFNAGGNFYGSTNIDWVFGATATPSTSTATNPTGIVYNTFGKKAVTIRYRAFGCDTSFTDSIEVYPSPAADFIIYDDEYCIGDSNVVEIATLSDTSWIHYWDFEDTTFTDVNNPIYIYKDTGIKTVTLFVENSYGCLDTLIQNDAITILPSPTALFSPRFLKTSYYYPYVTFNNNSLNYDYSTFDDGTGLITSPFSTINKDYAIEGYYYPTLIVENGVGCFDTLIGEIFYEMKYNMFIPNSFTPNGDGVNDVFLPVSNVDSNFIMTIYNRWGETIFQTTDIREGWDGKSSTGVPLKTDTYVYRIVYRDPKSKRKEIIGHINLLRGD